MSVRKIFTIFTIAGVTLYLIGCFSQESRIRFGMPAAFAQETTAAIYGTATDAKGGLVPGVKVTAVNEGTGTQREAVTNDQGGYTIPLLPAGKYTITAEMPGFATLRVTNVALQVSINSNVPIVLEPKQVSELVSVEAQNNRIDTSNATLKFSVTNEQVSGLPVLTSVTGRNSLSLLPFLLPGVTPTDTLGTARNSNTTGSSMSVNGSRPASNSYNFEGATNNNPEFNESATSFPNPDALQEFTILTNGYQADQGRNSGGIVNAIVKSGTNQFHGNVRYFLVNEALNARGFFDPQVPVNRLNTFGGQLGGPLIIPSLYNSKGRTFFFFDYEGTRSRRGRTANISVPTEKQRRGDFSELPTSQRPRDPLTGQPFPGGVIPESRINSISRTYLDRFIPPPNDGLNNFLFVAPTDFNSNQYTARLDQRIGSADDFSATVYANLADSQSTPSTVLPINNHGNSVRNGWSVTLSETHTFSPRVVNQFTGSVVRYVTIAHTDGTGATGISPNSIGFTGINPQTEKYLAIPAVTISTTPVIRIDPRVAFLNLESFGTTWQVQDNLSYARQNHTFKFGGDVSDFILNSFKGNNNGSFTFARTTANATNNALANFLLGISNAYAQNTGNTLYPRQQSYFFYGMDDWRARPNLTINLGLRYELITPLTDKLGQAVAFRPGRQSQRFPQAPPGLLFPGDPDPVLGTVPQAGYPTDKNNFAPRLGVAYAPQAKSGLLHTLFGERKTAIRAAFGIYYDAAIGTTSTDVAFIQPFSVSQTLTASQIRAAGGTFANPFGSRPNPFPIDLSHRAFTGAPDVEPVDPTFRTAYVYHYNLTLQRELPWSMLLELAYVGSSTFKQNRERELNLSVVTPDATPDNFQERRLFPLLGSISTQESTGRARYDAAQLRLARRFRSGLAFDVSYVFSKTLDNGSLASVDFSAGPERWARSNYDRRHNFVLSYTYEIPRTTRDGFVGQLVNGWQLGGIWQVRSGLPLEIQQFVDPTLTNGSRPGIPDLVGPFIRFDPRRFQTIVFHGVPVSGNFLFDPNAFQAVPTDDPTKARPGTLGRNLFDGPGLNLWDMTINKKFRVTESQSIEFRADIRNLFNHALFDAGFDTTVPTEADDVSFSQFGQVTSSGVGVGGRQIQFSLRYTF
jgi:outer membrane receptor protein involved in Fe transport